MGHCRPRGLYQCSEYGCQARHLRIVRRLRHRRKGFGHVSEPLGDQIVFVFLTLKLHRKQTRLLDLVHIQVLEIARIDAAPPTWVFIIISIEDDIMSGHGSDPESVIRGRFLPNFSAVRLPRSYSSRLVVACLSALLSRAGLCSTSGRMV